MIQNDVTGNLFVMVKKISDDPKQVGRIMHLITHDYSDLSKTPQGTSAVLNAMRKKGLNIKDIGNKYLREHLQTKLTEKRQRRQQQGGVMTTPVIGAVLPPSTSGMLPITPPTHIALSRLQKLSNEMSKRLTPAGKLPTPLPPPSSHQQQHPSPLSKEFQETPSRKKSRKDDGTRYSL